MVSPLLKKRVLLLSNGRDLVCVCVLLNCGAVGFRKLVASSCFSQGGLQKVPWHDFVDSLQEQFLKGFCPKDPLPQPERRFQE